MAVAALIAAIIVITVAAGFLAYWRNTPKPPTDVYARTVAALGDPYQLDWAAPFDWPADSAAKRRHRQAILDRLTNEH